MTTQKTHAAPDLAGLTDYTAQKWNIAAQKYRENRTPENHAAAVAAQREHERAVQMAKSPALYAAAPDLLAALAAIEPIVAAFVEDELSVTTIEEAAAILTKIRAALAKAKGEA